MRAHGSCPEMVKNSFYFSKRAAERLLIANVGPIIRVSWLKKTCCARRKRYGKVTLWFKFSSVHHMIMMIGAVVRRGCPRSSSTSPATSHHRVSKNRNRDRHQGGREAAADANEDFFLAMAMVMRMRGCRSSEGEQQHHGQRSPLLY